MKLLVLLLAIVALRPCAGRPEVLQEQHLFYPWAFLKGAYCGYEILLSLLGLDDEMEEVIYDDGVAYEDVIHPAPREEQTTIQIVGLGLPRTGSTSLTLALEQLGYTAVHDDEHVELADLYHYWEEDVIDSEQFHDILGQRGYNASFKTDYQWVAQHPEVKAILTVRDSPESYVKSYLVVAPFVGLMHKFPFNWMPTVKNLIESFDEEWKLETTGGRPEEFLNPNVLHEAYVEYNQAVKAAIPAERLLTLNAKEGWGPLCNFLGVPVPKGIPYPHVHTRAKIQGEMFFLRAVIWASRLSVVLLVGAFAYSLQKVCGKE